MTDMHLTVTGSKSASSKMIFEKYDNSLSMDDDFEPGFFTKKRRIAIKEKHSDIPMQVDDEILEGKKKLYLTTKKR